MCPVPEANRTSDGPPGGRLSRSLPSSRCSRRRFLTRLGALGVAATALPALLSACAGSQAGSAAGQPTAISTMAGMSDGMTMTPSGAPAADLGTPAPNEVFIDNFSFQPAGLTVPSGTTVTWTNHDDVPHTVTSRQAGLFGSQALDTGDHFSHRFETPGTYAYYCAIHPIMNGQVIVQ